MKPIRLAVCRSAPKIADHGRSAAARAPAAAASELVTGQMPSLQFGDDTVYYGAGSSWDRFKDSAARARTEVREHPEQIDSDRLHVVIQKGGLFQREHPEVRVLVNKGRFLLVELDPGRARELGKSDLPCFSVRPIGALKPAKPRGRQRVVFEPAARAAAAPPNPAIQGVVNNIVRQSYEGDLTGLVGFNTRNSVTPQYKAACNFVDQKLAALGYVTSRQTITVNGTACQNVIALRKGSGPASRREVVVSAHLDSINIEGNATSPAPGADDDGSGSAGVIAIARALKNHSARNDLRLVLFGGEEQGLFGSKQYVAALNAAARARIAAVVQMDMIGSLNSPDPTVLLEGAPVSQPVIAGLAAAAATYTRLAVKTSLNPADSDHFSFIKRNIPAVLTIEGADHSNHNIHTPRDTLDRINFDLALEILRMNTAFVAIALNKP